MVYLELIYHIVSSRGLLLYTVFIHTVAMLQGEPSLLHTPICVHQLVVHKHCNFKVNGQLLQLKKSSSLPIGQYMMFIELYFTNVWPS